MRRNMQIACAFLLCALFSVLAEGIKHEDGFASEALSSPALLGKDPSPEFTETFTAGTSKDQTKSNAGFWRRRRRTRTAPAATKAAMGYNPPRVFTGGSHAGTETSLGDELQHTFKNPGHMPLTADDALDDGWTHHDECSPDLGILFTPENYGRENPLRAYFTPAGQIAGLKLTIWGSSGPFETSKFKGPAALGNMVKQGYYIPVKGKAHTWEISVSFRSPSETCSEAESSQPIGDRLVINQHTIKKSIPMTSSQAATVGMQPGSCMKQMGQHWFYDLQSGPKMTWNPGNLLPIVPMFAEGSDRINAFFFTTPACQYDSGHNWDNVPVKCSLTAAMMCQNFCQSDCPSGVTDILRGKSPWKDPTTYRWGTMHVFFNDHLDSVTCKGGGGLLNRMGRTCPANTLVAKAKAASRRRFFRV